jgi:type I restriction enzyme S subunit
VKTGDIRTGVELFDSVERLTTEGAKNARMLPKGAVMVTCIGNLGNIAIAGKEMATNQQINSVVFSKYVDDKFGYYACNLLKPWLIKNSTSTTISMVNKSVFQKAPFPLPPLAEQQRIVAKLDILFTHLESLKTRLEHIPQLLKNFRQAVLTQAVTGKLTKEWRVGKELEEWEEVKLQNITKKIGSGSTPKGGSASYKEEGIPLVRSMNIHFNGIKLKGLAFIDEDQAERLKNVIIEENDILLNITGASIGRVCIAEEDIIGGRVNQHVTIIRLSEGHSSEYINMYLASSIIQNYIFNENYGVTRQALTKTQTQNLEINLPPKQEQTEIVKRVEALFAKTETIETQYQSLKTKIDRLPQAILQKAFKGEL